jgi:hypothetical protein
MYILLILSKKKIDRMNRIELDKKNKLYNKKLLNLVYPVNPVKEKLNTFPAYLNGPCFLIPLSVSQISVAIYVTTLHHVSPAQTCLRFF